MLPEHNRAEDNFILSKDLPVECGVNRVLIRSTEQAGTITLTAEADGLPTRTITLQTESTDAAGGLSTYMPSRLLESRLDRGETPATPSYQDELITVDITGATSPMGDTALVKTYDDNEYTSWINDGDMSTAEITYTLERAAAIKDIAVKLTDFKSRTYPLEVYAGSQQVWKGWTVPSLGYAHLVIDTPQTADTYRIRMFAQRKTFSPQHSGVSQVKSATAAKATLGIIEIDFMEAAPKEHSSTNTEDIETTANPGSNEESDCVRKFIRDGQLYILRSGKIYTVMGIVVH